MRSKTSDDTLRLREQVESLTREIPLVDLAFPTPGGTPHPMSGISTYRPVPTPSSRSTRKPFLDDELEALVAVATHAPSGDNTQPWRFLVDRARGMVSISVDPRRDLSPMNAGQRMARIACGAALENLVQAARSRGIAAEIECSDTGDIMVRLRRDALYDAPVTTTQALRVTNRRCYDARRLSVEQLVTLAAATAPANGVTTHWIGDRARLPALADVIGRADAMMFSQPAMRNAFFDQVRFDQPREQALSEGMPLGSLEVTVWQARGMRLMRVLPQAFFMATGGAGVFARQARGLVRSASGLCVVASVGKGPAADIAVGRAMQRAWLALTRLGACAQPMMSLTVIANLLEHGSPMAVVDLGLERSQTLLTGFKVLLPELTGERPAFILRFGFASAPTGRTGRRPLHEVIHEATSTGEKQVGEA